MAEPGSRTPTTAALLTVTPLPVNLRALIGRQRELAELDTVARQHRLVTVTGPGGVGKTRLCLGLATMLAERDVQVTWVGLASVDTVDQIATAIAAALGVQAGSGIDPLDAACAAIATSTTLIVLDNCEHVVELAAATVEHLLSVCAALRIVATSRAVLAVSGEAVYRLDGLGVTSSDGRQAPAVELFVERARVWLPDFGTQADLTAARDLCRRLDGLPLAVELAAARVDALSMSEIAASLDEGLRVLGNRTRGPLRHATLEATLAWSYHLLSPEQQAVLRRLSVFRGTLSRPSAEAVVCRAGSPAVAREDVIDHLAALVDQSLLQVGRVGDEPRYHLLETVGAYARAVLSADTDELHEAERLHTAVYTTLATEAEAGQSGPDQHRWSDRLELENDNVRAALSRTLGRSKSGDAEAGGRLAGMLWPFWYRRGRYTEARHWLEAAVQLAEQSDRTRTQVLLGAGTFAFLQCDYHSAEHHLDRAATLANSLDDRLAQAAIAQRRGSIARETGRYGKAISHHEDALRIWRALGDRREEAVTLDYLAFAAWMAGDLAEAEAYSLRAVAASDLLAGQQEQATAVINLAGIRIDQGSLAEARELLANARDLSEDLDYREGLAWTAHLQGLVDLASDDVPAAIRGFSDSLCLHVELGDSWRAASVLDSLAAALIAWSRPGGAGTQLRPGAAGPGRDAAIFAAAAEQLRRRIGTPVPAVDAARFADLHARLRSVAGPLPPMDALVARAGELAATLPDMPVVHASTGLGDRGLTERETAVLSLIRRGLTNREIGAQLFISPSTAGVHVSNILRKIGATNRVQAAAMAGEGPASDASEQPPPHA